MQKKKITYSGIFKPYSDVLKPYSGVFLQKKFVSTRFGSPIVAFLSPIVTFLCPIAAFSCNYGNRVFKTRFSRGFFWSTRKNSSFILELDFLETRDASFQHCFETWQLTKFFYIYCYLARKIIYLTCADFKFSFVFKKLCGKYSCIWRGIENNFLLFPLTYHFFHSRDNNND